MLSSTPPPDRLLPFPPPKQPARRIPTLLNTLLFLALTLFGFLLAEAAVLAAFHSHPILDNLQNQRLQLAANALAYLIAVLAATLVFPLLWHQPFFTGLRWNGRRANPLWLFAGLALGLVSQAVESQLTLPKHVPLDDLFHTPHTIWFLVVFGTLVAPAFEEILFRGFLLPALANLADYLRLPRSGSPAESLERLAHFHATESHSRPALVVASLVTSILFALIHAPQLGYTWPAVALLGAVSLVLCYVRLRTRSVAVSAMVHAAYNFSVFLSLFVVTGAFQHMDRA